MKFMNMKRFGSVVMAGALALSLAVPAFATTTTPKGQVTITGTYEDIPISVSVPTTGTAQINPYGLPVNFTLSDTVTKVAVSGQQITSAPLSIRNQGTTKLAVNATLAVATEGGVSVKQAALTSSEDGKQINLGLQVATLDDVKYAVSSLDTTLEDNIIKAFAADATWANAKTIVAKDTGTSVAIADAPVTKSSDTAANGGCGGAMAALGAATVGAGDLITYGKDSIAVFRLNGKVNESPQKAATAPASGKVDDPWVAADKFSAQVVFKFKPYKEATLTLSATATSIGTSSPNNTAAVTATFTAGDTGLTVTKYDWTSGTTATATCTPGGTAAATSTTVTSAAAGTTEIKCVATLSDNTTKEATITITVA